MEMVHCLGNSCLWITRSSKELLMALRSSWSRKQRMECIVRSFELVRSNSSMSRMEMVQLLDNSYRLKFHNRRGALQFHCNIGSRLLGLVHMVNMILSIHFRCCFGSSIQRMEMAEQHKSRCLCMTHMSRGQSLALRSSQSKKQWMVRSS